MARPLLDRATTSSHVAGAVPLLLLLLLVAAAAVASVVMSLCTSSKNAKQKWTTTQRGARGGSPPAPQPDDEQGGSVLGKKQLLASLSGIGGGKKQLLSSLSGIGGKAAAVAKMVSWNRRSSPPAADGEWNSSGSDGDADQVAAVGQEEALWKKTIIMGDKCRPLEFSGQIAYDSDGNPLPPPQPAPTAESMKKSAADADDRVNINDAGS